MNISGKFSSSNFFLRKICFIFNLILVSQLKLFFFRALLFGGLRESSQNEIFITESSVDAFKILLKYIYTGLINLNNLKV